ncbi:twin-arginine translocase TatA/TatE family subunit [Agromyces aureus]|uniref:Sec-independent protein translocase protein TatA n=1 Tax=Agromyces aureus TaxID=453304 RepID=A0A191WHP6_9MICO|nr:twin-arginine translocase TatA/TatE family subunit [Agromyces aureus]ANJ27781.1 hypothetical protein ATC03_14750 [Agromyces aureus]
MLANLNGWHAAIIIAVILLLFGAPKIPMLARSLGQSMRIFKTEVRDQGDVPRDSAEAPAAPVSPATTPASATAAPAPAASAPGAVPPIAVPPTSV